MTPPQERKDEAGFNLMELTVTVLLLGIISTMLFNYLDNTTHLTARATASVMKENEGREALRILTQDVRAANRILGTYPTNAACAAGGSYPAGYGNCLAFEIQRSVDSSQACPKSVMAYGVVGNELRQTRIDYASNCTTVVRTINGKVLLRNVVATGTPLFQYYDGTGTMIPTSATTASFADAASIRVNVSVRFKTGAPNLDLNSSVALRNNR